MRNVLINVFAQPAMEEQKASWKSRKSIQSSEAGEGLGSASLSTSRAVSMLALQAGGISPGSSGWGLLVRSYRDTDRLDC